MRSIPVCIAFLLLTATACSQAMNWKGISFQLSAGLNNHSYTRNYSGWYFRTGIEKRIRGGLGIGLTYTHTAFNSFPRQFHMYNFQPGSEQALLDQWKGISEKDWITARKGYYKLITGDLLSLHASYQFNLGKKFILATKLGISHIAAVNHTTGVFEAQFVNDRLTGGRIGYDFRNSRLAGWNFGFTIGYRLSNRVMIQLLGEDNRDINGQLFNYYESKLLGAGLQYRLSRE